MSKRYKMNRRIMRLGAIGYYTLRKWSRRNQSDFGNIGYVCKNFFRWFESNRGNK